MTYLHTNQQFRILTASNEYIGLCYNDNKAYLSYGVSQNKAALFLVRREHADRSFDTVRRGEVLIFNVQEPEGILWTVGTEKSFVLANISTEEMKFRTVADGSGDDSLVFEDEYTLIGGTGNSFTQFWQYRTEPEGCLTVVGYSHTTASKAQAFTLELLPLPTGCVEEGKKCSTSQPCCDGLLCTQGGVCVAVGSCGAAGDVCVADAECCAGHLCEQNKCVQFKCQELGFKCSMGRECCSQHCTEGACTEEPVDLGDICSLPFYPCKENLVCENYKCVSEKTGGLSTWALILIIFAAILVVGFIIGFLLKLVFKR